jgi:prephenate dehydratase
MEVCIRIRPLWEAVTLISSGESQEGKSLAVENDSKYKNITKLYTHPQVWGQCEKFLSKHFKGVERQDVSATSKAAEIVSKETSNDSAAIGSKFAGDHQKLLALAENIEDDPSNTTRFLLLRNAKSQRTRHGLCRSSAPQPTGESRAAVKRKTLISFLVDHNSPGALADALVVFKGHGLNLTTITTRPGGIHSWQYIFFVECQRNLEIHDDNVVERVMQDLQHVTEKCRDLGSWDDQLPSS